MIYHERTFEQTENDEFGEMLTLKKQYGLVLAGGFGDFPIYEGSYS